MNKLTSYTHTDVKITDIRLKKGQGAKEKDQFFAVTVEGIQEVLYINYNIFNDRIKAFFLGKSVNEIDRESILNLKWNFIITEGHYLKIVDKTNFERINGVDGKMYVSVLEISGPIGTFKNNFGESVSILTAASTH